MNSDMSEELKKAAKDYCRKMEFSSIMSRNLDFIAGAEWQEKQVKEQIIAYGWVARNRNDSLQLFQVEPRRGEGYWWDRDYASTVINHEMFPDLTWNDDPICVDIAIIKR